MAFAQFWIVIFTHSAKQSLQRILGPVSRNVRSVKMLVSTAFVVTQQHLMDPCGEMRAQGMRCRMNQECRLVMFYCTRPPCSPQPTCVPKFLRVGSCPYGDPVLGMDYRPLSCYEGHICPYQTTCYRIAMDRQSSCCWVPRRPTPFHPNSPPPRYDPCMSTMCYPRQICEVRFPRHCFHPPCPPIGVCIAAAPRPSAHVASPCAVTLCDRGFHCEERSTPCAPPGPCPLWGECIRDIPIAGSTATPTTGNKTGTCPAVTGICDNNCEWDSDCDTIDKCCHHTCGALCSKPLEFLTTTPAPSPTSDNPCSTLTCSNGTECRLRQVFCQREPCQAFPTCLMKIPKPLLPRCPVGDPVLDVRNNELYCGADLNQSVCPEHTFCNKHPSNQIAVCCHGVNTHHNHPTTPTPAVIPTQARCSRMTCGRNEVCKEETLPCVSPPCPGPKPVCHPTYKPGSCPKQSPSRHGSCITSCSADGDCPGKLKCCGQCPRRCTQPASSNEKPGLCPVSKETRIGGMCMVRCFTDSQCPDDKKCCGKCHKFCRTPEPDPAPAARHPITPSTRSNDKPGTCPSTVGRAGTCMRLCFNDGSCPGTHKCCSNGCGHTCQEAAGSQATYADSDPCKTQPCGINHVCQLQQGMCFGARCTVITTCVSEYSVSSPSVCRSGYPVTDTSKRPIRCHAFHSTCPDNTVCSSGVCCWDTSIAPVPRRPMHIGPSMPQGVLRQATMCPRVFGERLMFACMVFVSCSADEDCNAGEKCCLVIACGMRCMTPMRQ